MDTTTFNVPGNTGGLYRHYKGQYYRVLAVAKHSETSEPFVFYEALYENSLGKFWVRPYSLFFSTIVINKTHVPRFLCVDPDFHLNHEHTVKKDWAQRGFGFDIFVNPPGQIWKDSVHDDDEIFMLVSGSLKVTIEGQEQPLFPEIGIEYAIPAGRKHTLEYIGSIPSCVFAGERQHSLS